MFSQWGSDQLVFFILSLVLGVPLISALLYLLQSGLRYQWICSYSLLYCFVCSEWLM
jgi:hypothetical protein